MESFRDLIRLENKHFFLGNSKILQKSPIGVGLIKIGHFLNNKQNNQSYLDKRFYKIFALTNPWP